MSNLSDKELDRLSREAADSYEPDTSSLSWSRLEQKLIEQMPERPPDGFRFGRINPYLWGPAVVLLAGISYYLIKNSNYSQHSTRTSEQSSQNIPKSNIDSSRSNARAIYTDSLSVARNASPPGTKNTNPREQPGSASSHRDATKNSPSVPGRLPADTQTGDGIDHANQQARKGDKNTTRNGGGSKFIIPSAAVAAGSMARNGNTTRTGSAVKPSQTTDLSNSPENAATDITASGIILSGKTTSSAANEKRDAVTREAYKHDLPLLAGSGASLGKIKGNDSLFNKSTPSDAPVPQKTVHINRSLNIGFTFGADYTDAGGISNNQFSNNIGLTLGYYLTSKLSVNTGILYSNKFYWSPGHGPDRPAYSQGAGNPTTFAYSPDIEFVNGSCNMYELPLTLRYDFAKNDKTRFFVNAGVSSYFMLKQTYIYFFHSGGRIMAWKANDESQSNYWFGMGDLSFGLETDIGKGFSFQAEPFFRIPFQKMGVENLKIYSYGFMLSFRYAPVLSRSKK